MLAALLLNLPVAPPKRLRPRWYVKDERFVVIDGETIDTETAPDRDTVKKVSKALRKVKLTNAEKKQVSNLSFSVSDFGESADLYRKAEALKAYAEAVETLKKAIVREEEEELLTLLLSI